MYARIEKKISIVTLIFLPFIQNSAEEVNNGITNIIMFKVEKRKLLENQVMYKVSLFHFEIHNNLFILIAEFCSISILILLTLPKIKKSSN